MSVVNRSSFKAIEGLDQKFSSMESLGDKMTATNKKEMEISKKH